MCTYAFNLFDYKRILLYSTSGLFSHCAYEANVHPVSPDERMNAGDHITPGTAGSIKEPIGMQPHRAYKVLISTTLKIASPNVHNEISNVRNKDISQISSLLRRKKPPWDQASDTRASANMT